MLQFTKLLLLLLALWNNESESAQPNILTLYILSEISTTRQDRSFTNFCFPCNIIIITHSTKYVYIFYLGGPTNFLCHKMQWGKDKHKQNITKQGNSFFVHNNIITDSVFFHAFSCLLFHKKYVHTKNKLFQQKKKNIFKRRRWWIGVEVD